MAEGLSVAQANSLLTATAVGQLISTRRLLASGREPSMIVSGHELTERP